MDSTKGNTAEELVLSGIPVHTECSATQQQEII